MGDTILECPLGLTAAWQVLSERSLYILLEPDFEPVIQGKLQDHLLWGPAGIITVAP